MRFNLLGVAKTRAALEAAMLQAKAAERPAVEAGGQIVARQMISRPPRDTGRLISLINIDDSAIGDGTTAKVGSDAPYDRFVQLGTVYMSANPYGQQAAAASVPGIIGVMTGIFKAAIRG